MPLILYLEYSPVADSFKDCYDVAVGQAQEAAIAGWAPQRPMIVSGGSSPSSRDESAEQEHEAARCCEQVSMPLRI